MDAHRSHRAANRVLSPADQAFAMTVSTAIFSMKRHAPYPKAMWLLPLLLGAAGGIVAWLVVSDRDEDAARAMLFTGAIVQLVIGVVWMLTAAGGAMLGAISSSGLLSALG